MYYLQSDLCIWTEDNRRRKETTVISCGRCKIKANLSPPARDDGHSVALWKGYLKSSLFPRLPELTSMTLIGLVLSPVLYIVFCV